MKARGARVVVVALVLAVTSLFAACARVPTGGPVQFESMGSGDPDRGSLRVVVDGPHPGDSPLQVARGFMAAMASYEAGQPSARKYLDPAVRERWQPRALLVYDSAAIPTTEPEPGKVLMDAPKVAEVGATGAWTPAAPGEKISIDLRMRRVDGEWRVGRPPDALVMSVLSFEREYKPYKLYFFDPEFEILVPDQVYLPIRGHTETMLVNALLRGPSPWLGPAATSAVPEGTKLAAPSVTIEGSTATVNLDRRALGLYDSQRRFLRAQLSWTLGQLAPIQRVRVNADRVSLGVEDVGSRSSAAAWSIYDPVVAGAARSAYALSGGKVVVVGSDRLVPVSGRLGRLPIAARSIAVSVYGERTGGQALDPGEPAAADWLAVVTSDGRAVRVYGSDGHYGTVFQGRDILEPSWDRTGKLWLVDRRGGKASIATVDDQDQRVSVVAPGLAGEDVRGLKVSREGARVAALVQRGDRTALLVGRIERGDVTAIRGLRELPVPLSSMSDVAWQDLDKVVVIGSDGESPPRPMLVSADGSRADPLGAGPISRSLAAAPGEPVLLGGEDGRLHSEDKKYVWSDQGVGTAPAYPG